MILLDTHVAIWAAFDDSALGKNCRRLVRRASDQNELAVSAISFWEIAMLAGELEDLHADPADRFIAATAIVHDGTLATADERLLKSRHIPHKQNAET